MTGNISVIYTCYTLGISYIVFLPDVWHRFLLQSNRCDWTGSIRNGWSSTWNFPCNKQFQLFRRRGTSWFQIRRRGDCTSLQRAPFHSGNQTESWCPGNSESSPRNGSDRSQQIWSICVLHYVAWWWKGCHLRGGPQKRQNGRFNAWIHSDQLSNTWKQAQAVFRSSM